MATIRTTQYNIAHYKAHLAKTNHTIGVQSNQIKQWTKKAKTQKGMYKKDTLGFIKVLKTNNEQLKKAVPIIKRIIIKYQKLLKRLTK